MGNHHKITISKHLKQIQGKALKLTPVAEVIFWNKEHWIFLQKIKKVTGCTFTFICVPILAVLLRTTILCFFLLVASRDSEQQLVLYKLLHLLPTDWMEKTDDLYKVGIFRGPINP